MDERQLTSPKPPPINVVSARSSAGKKAPNHQGQQRVTLPRLVTGQERHSAAESKAQRTRNHQGGGSGRIRGVQIGTWGTGTPPPIVVNQRRQQEANRRRPYKVLSIGATPLMHACQQADRPRVLKLLQDQSGTIGYRDRALRSALHYCMDAGTAGAVATAAPELVNAPDAEGHAPLHLAVIAGDTQLVAVLLANGADVNAKDHEGHSVLHWATVCGEVECVRLILAAGARPSSPDQRGGSPLHYAAQCCGAPATAELAVPKKLGLRVLETLLEFGADVEARDEDGRQPILWAASAGSVEAVLALVRAGGSAVAGGSDKDGLTALHCAASRGHARCIDALVNLCGAQPDHVDDNGCSALHYAATLGHADATALLLRYGADPNRQDRKGRTPALCAAAKGQLETLKILAQHGGVLHARTVRGTGIGHEAAASGRLDLVKWLAKKRRGLLEATTQDGKTPLHVAALHGHLDVCKLLLDQGVKVNAQFKTGKGSILTPLDAALLRGHRDCAKLIQLHGGLPAQHAKSKKSGPVKVFSSKLRVHSNLTSDSDSSSSPPRLRDSNVYYEERWTDRRSKKHSNKQNKHLSRQDSRSLSEEELRLTKVSKDEENNERRARSENARYSDKMSGDEQTQMGKVKRKTKQRRRVSTVPESSSEFGSGSAEKSDEDDDHISVSDDSLEVVVVKRSLERKCEKIVSETKLKSSKDAGNTIKSRKKLSRRTKNSVMKKSGNLGKKETKSHNDDVKERENISRSESPEKVRISADVYDQEEKSKSEYKFDPEDEQMRSKMDDILEKADELQNALLTKAADLRKDMEEMRSQMTSLPKQDDDDTNIEQSKEDNNEIEEQKQPGSKRGSLEKVPEEGSRSKRSSITKDEEKLTDSKRSSFAKQSGESSECPTIVIQSDEVIESRRNSVVPENENTPGSKRASIDKNVDAANVSKRSSLTQSETNESPGSKRASIAQVESNEQNEIEAVLGDEQGNENQNADTISQEEQQDLPGSKRSSITKEEVPASKRGSLVDEVEGVKSKRSSWDKSAEGGGSKRPSISKEEQISGQGQSISKESEEASEQKRPSIMKGSSTEGRKSLQGQESEGIRFADESSSSSPQSQKQKRRPSTAKRRASIKPPSNEEHGGDSSGEHSADNSAIVAVIESTEWGDDEGMKENSRNSKDANSSKDNRSNDQPGDESEIDGSLGLIRILPNTSEEEGGTKTSTNDSLPQLPSQKHSSRPQSPQYTESSHRGRSRQRRDSGGKDSGIEPSPRVSRIPRRTHKCCPNTEKQENLHIDTITRDVQINLRRYHLERKIFFQLMELKRLQIRHGRANEQVLVKRQVDAFHKAGMTGPIVGVAKYDQAYTFRGFEGFLYEQLRKLQRRPCSPDWCGHHGAKQCTQKTHRCHHATSAYTSLPIYTYLGGGGGPEKGNRLPKIESKGRGQMTLELVNGDDKQVIALPTEKLDQAKRYYVTFTVHGESDLDEGDKLLDIPSSVATPSAGDEDEPPVEGTI